MAMQSTRTVAFLFTDIEGSTQRWERDRDAMAEALLRHDDLLRDVIEHHGGHVFKTVGDAFCAAFACPAKALAAALSAQRALATLAGTAVGPIRVRMAIHLGIAEERDADYFGPAVNRVARLLAAGHGGQVLLSLAVEQLVRDVLPAGVTLRELGEHRFKGLARPERIFQVVARDLPADFPRLQTLTDQRHNLPPSLTPFVGRDGDVAIVRQRLERPDARLVTLTGPGGVGKTRLALQVAADVVDRFADGVWFSPLPPIRDPSLVMPTIARALGLPYPAEPQAMDEVVHGLRSTQLLLILDNFEQVGSVAPMIADLLEGAPDLKILATSRAPLRISGECEFAVLPLALPAPTPAPSADHLVRYDAVRLFVDRAQAVKADFALTDDNAAAVAEICRRLDGLPLAIALAAARVKLLPPSTLLARLEKPLPLLVGGPRDQPARLQAMRDAIAWSYELLSAREQTLFRRLATLVAGFDLAAAETAMGSATESMMDLVEGLAFLVDQSLLQQTIGADDWPRFAMLETVREFALEQLHECSEARRLVWSVGVARRQRRIERRHYARRVEWQYHARGAELNRP